MRYFVCLLDAAGIGISEGVRRQFESLPRRRGLDFSWHSGSGAAVLLVRDDPWGDPLIAARGDWLGVGIVRLDNRRDLERWSGAPAGELTDLELVLEVVRQHGTQYVPRILGDFGFLVWNGSTRRAIAACDAFALRALYYTISPNSIAFASRAESLALHDRYNVQYLAERVACATPSPGLTVYGDVISIPAGAMALLEAGKLTCQYYWKPEHFEPVRGQVKSDHEAAEGCRQLLFEGVRHRLTGEEDTWAQLSGGLDSSSVASIAQWFFGRGEVAHGLTGSVTYVDQEGAGSDERQYSEAVVSRWGLRNEAIVNAPMWYDSKYPPPHIDQPRFDFMFYPRDCRLCDIVRSAGGRVLLTGQGSDELLRGNMLFFADWIAQGRIGAAILEMTRRAAIGRVSVWQLAYLNAVLPLLPARIRVVLTRGAAALPSWVNGGMARRYSLRAQAIESLAYAGRFAKKYHHAVVTSLVAVSRTTGYGVIGDTLDVRHPFLYRPLVEFGLRLPPELCVRPHARKWVLREAMRGILPESIRERVGKGTATERYAWSLATQRQLLEPLLGVPILSDLGIINGVAFRNALEAAMGAPGREGDVHGTLQGVLAIEAWLQVRAGRWPSGSHNRSARVTGQSNHPSAEGNHRRYV